MCQMENVFGNGMNQRNCSVVGLTIFASAVGSFFNAAIGLPVLAGAILTGASGDCF